MQQQEKDIILSHDEQNDLVEVGTLQEGTQEDHLAEADGDQPITPLEEVVVEVAEEGRPQS